MSRARHTEAEIIAALKQVEAGRKAEDVAREVGSVQAHDLRLEGEVRRDGRERGAGSEAVAGRKRATEETGGGSEFGQGRVAIGDSKKRVELAVLKAAVGQVRQEYAFSQRRACGLLTMAVSSYRYQSRRSDEGLRVRLVELAREKPRFGLSAACMCCCDAAEKR